MPSKTFQPLLFENFKYKYPDTTYIDHYGKKHKRKEFSTIQRAFSGIISQKDRMSLMTQRSRPFSNHSFMKKFNPNAKLNVNFDQKVEVKEIVYRGSSAGTSSVTIANLETNEKNHNKLVSPPPQQQTVLSPAPVEQLVEKFQKTTISDKIEPKNDYHWMVYKQEEMPNYILEAKKRLGQIKEPHIAPNQVKDKPPKAPERVQEKVKLEDPIVEVVKQESNKHWIQWDNPRTPENVAEIRRRLGDDRYKRTNSLVNSVARSKTISSFDRPKSEAEEVQKVEVSQAQIEEQILPTETTIDENGVKYIVTYEPRTEVTHTSFKTNLPYYQQLGQQFNYFDKEHNESVNNYFDETVNYMNLESGNDTNKFILPANDNEQASNDKNFNKSDPKSVPFQTWVQNASDQDRNAVLKILNDLEHDKSKQLNEKQFEARVSSRMSNNQFNNYNKVRAKNVSSQSTQSSLLKKRPATSSSIRKLGVTRNKYQVPIDENLEKILIKHSLWSNEINGPATVHFGYNV